jgi:hypothetical protein
LDILSKTIYLLSKIEIYYQIAKWSARNTLWSMWALDSTKPAKNTDMNFLNPIALKKGGILF